MTTSDLFTELEVLSMIQEDDKLCIRDGHISIEKRNHPFKVAIRRFFNNDGRRLTLMQINSIISKALHTCSEVRNDPDGSWKLEQFSILFRNVIVGLENLKKTYSDDSAIVARLKVIIELLKVEVTKICETFAETNDAPAVVFAVNSTQTIEKPIN